VQFEWEAPALGRCFTHAAVASLGGSIARRVSGCQRGATPAAARAAGGRLRDTGPCGGVRCGGDQSGREHGGVQRNGWEDALRVYRLPSTLVRTRPDLPGGVQQIEFSRSGRWMVTAHSDGSVRIWRTG